MKRQYVLIDDKKLNMPNWIMFLVCYFVFSFAMSIAETLISNMKNISIVNVEQITLFIRGAISLSLIHDLVTRFKKSISILYSVLAFLIYINIDYKSGDKLFLGAFIFLVSIILFNIYLYIKPYSLSSK